MESTQTSDDKPAFSGRILGMNLDLMTLIAHQIPPRTDISRFMKACRAFHTIGAPALLSHGGSVYLSCKNELESFHAFMFPKFHTSTRRLFPYLRGLWLSLERLHQDAPSVKMLCDLLPNCTHLYSFEAEGMEELLAIVPTLFDTLRVQPNLTELYMHASEERATELLAVIRTPLRKLELGRDHPQDPVYFSEFKRFASTLTALTMFSGELDFDDLPSNLVFPLLRDLEIRVKTTVPSARIFRTFPNIKKLELRETSVPEDDEWDELHDESMEELEAYDGPRPSLDVVQGDSILLDSCALYCPIKTFLVDVMALDRVDHIANLVQTCHISTLHVGLEGLKECNEELARLGFKLSRIPVQTLKALRVDVQLDPKDVNVLREVAAVLPRRLAVFRLESCIVNLYFKRLHSSGQTLNNLYVFRGFNRKQFAASIVKCSPTLREIVCEGSSSLTDSFRATWTVKEDGTIKRQEEEEDLFGVDATC